MLKSKNLVMRPHFADGEIDFVHVPFRNKKDQF